MIFFGVDQPMVKLCRRGCPSMEEPVAMGACAVGW
jgi:hypothetical protein